MVLENLIRDHLKYSFFITKGLFCSRFVSTGVKTHVVRKLLDIMNHSTAAAEELSHVWWDLLLDSWTKHYVTPPVTAEGCQPSKAVVRYWLSREKSRTFITSTEILLTSAFRPCESCFLTSPCVTTFIHYCLGVASVVNRAVSERSLSLLI